MKKDIFLIAILVIISFLAQVIFINPLVLSDQMEYYHSAISFPHLPNLPSHWSMRIGLLLPVAILYRIVGHAEITYYAFPILSMLVLVTGIYLIGKLLINQRVGFFSALWFITIPSILLESGHLLPDIPASASITIGFFFLLSLINEKNQKKRNFFALIGGVLFGWSYLIKEYFVIFLLLIPLLFWIYKIPLRSFIFSLFLEL